MTRKVHGFADVDESLGKNYDFFIFRTVIDVRPTGVVVPLNDPNYIDNVTLPVTIKGNTYTTAAAYNAALNSQRLFNLLIETISLRGQPVIVGEVFEVQQFSPDPQLPITGSASFTTPYFVYNLRFVLEHNQSWDPEELMDALDGIGLGTPATTFVKSTAINTTNIYVGNFEF